MQKLRRILPTRTRNWIILILFIAIFVLSILGVWYVRSRPETTQSVEQVPDYVLNITFQGEDGETPLGLLEKHADSVTTEEQNGEEKVTSVNDFYAPEGQQWVFYINGEEVDEDADEFTTTNQQEVEWGIK